MNTTQAVFLTATALALCVLWRCSQREMPSAADTEDDSSDDSDAEFFTASPEPSAPPAPAVGSG